MLYYLDRDQEITERVNERKEGNTKMIVNGKYQYIKNGERKCCMANFENTGVKNEYGKVIWRKITKGQKTNIFAEQFIPDVPWATGKWFCKISGASVLERHPELKVETERSARMADDEYIEYLRENFEA